MLVELIVFAKLEPSHFYFFSNNFFPCRQTKMLFTTEEGPLQEGSVIRKAPFENIMQLLKLKDNFEIENLNK